VLAEPQAAESAAAEPPVEEAPSPASPAPVEQLPPAVSVPPLQVPEPVAPATPPQAVAEAAPPQAESPPAEDVPTIVARRIGPDRLASGTAIIRRGDNLWTIARRVYGDGLKYTTIYRANRDQIRNPARIYPGQVFDLPLVYDD